MKDKIMDMFEMEQMNLVKLSQQVHLSEMNRPGISSATKSEYRTPNVDLRSVLI